MANKTILIKFPDNVFHTASVNRFVSTPMNGKEIETIWYIDLTDIKDENEELVGSFSVIKDNKDGTYTNLDCGTPEDYEKIYEELKKEIAKKNYTNKDLSLLPYSINEVESYDFFKEMTDPEDHPTIEISENVKDIKREISTRIGAFVDPYFTKTYDLLENDICLRLTLIEEKMSPNKWEETKNDILSYLTLKRLEMKKGYILIKDASDTLNEIEEVALNNLRSAEEEPIVVEDDEGAEEIITIQDKPVVSFVEDIEDTKEDIKESEEEAKETEEEVENEISEKISWPEIEGAKETNNNGEYFPYVKTIYVLWNELLSNLASFVYYEYNSYFEIADLYNVSYLNITDNYRHVNKEILKLIDERDLSIDKKNVITINDNLTKYNFYIIPVEDYDVFVSLKESKNPYILTRDFKDCLTPIINGIKRKDIIVTEKETISVIK